MQSVITGNAASIAPHRHGWFLGHFITEDPARATPHVEVKWAHHKKGETNRAFAANKTAHSLSILISGRFRLQFQEPAGIREVLLHAQSDFALWPPGLPHNWLAEEDSIILTVRWPSLPNDQS
jgi:hypothetical protein